MVPSDYVRRLRAHVGHDWLLLPSAVALVERHSGELLLVRQADMADWSLPGGAIELGETPTQAVVREVAEETGLDIEEVELVTVVGGPRYRVVYASGDQVEYTSAIYRSRCRADQEPVPDGVELAELCWCPPERLDEYSMIPYVQNLLVDLGLLADTTGHRQGPAASSEGA
ncbi:NUDIX domain-containing protein [Ferrimicrobium sp.]|uniref:NUDIX domain-containing protein n=1 Tax=Ferrimicrobium sp. TaxID=2926050 RepID=UPI00260D98D4|nr:NUDIX domain-containing protein [Ferrimicrobium sp.]